MVRKSHIKRIFGKRKSTIPGGPPDEDAPDVYVDMLRIDTMDTVEWPGAQENQINLQWKDAPGEDGNPGRRMGNVRLIDPEETNRDDPAVWIDLPVIERMTLVRHPGAQEQVTSFQPSSADPQADELETARRVAIRRVTHAESNVDAQLDDSGYLADEGDYTRKADTIDDTQYLDVEIIESYPSTLHQGPSPQEVLVSLVNDDLKEMFSAPPGDAKRNPVRLDPFQNIVNVQWGGGATEIEAASTLWRDLALPDSPRLSISMWVRTPADLSDPVPLLQFAADNVPQPPDALPTWEGGSFVRAGGGVFQLLFGSRRDFDIREFITVTNGTGSPSDYEYGESSVWMIIQNSSEQWVDGVWNHIAISVDTSSSIEHITGVWPPDYNSSVGGSNAKFDGTFVINKELGDQNFQLSAIGFEFIRFGGVFWDYPNFDLNFTGRFGLPVQPQNASTAPSDVTNNANVDFAAVQIWHDQFIDFRDPDVLAKFVAPAGGNPSTDSVNGIRMVAPSVAQAAFGKPTFFFDGGPSKFAKNQGSGGEFTKIGDLKSFRPAPPKASAS
jgi:hypothetical protein